VFIGHMLSVQLDQENKIYKSELFQKNRMGSAVEQWAPVDWWSDVFFIVLNYIKLNKSFYDRNLPRWLFLIIHPKTQPYYWFLDSFASKLKNWELKIWWEKMGQSDKRISSCSKQAEFEKPTELNLTRFWKLFNEHQHQSIELYARLL
jgi:hypothetical protein